MFYSQGYWRYYCELLKCEKHQHHANVFLDVGLSLPSQHFFKIGEEEGQKKAHPLRVKKLYLLAAQLVQEHNSKMKNSMKEGM